MNELKEIQNSLINGNFNQMVTQINNYGLYYFWEDYWNHLIDFSSESSAIESFKDTVFKYFMITNK